MGYGSSECVGQVVGRSICTISIYLSVHIFLALVLTTFKNSNHRCPLVYPIVVVVVVIVTMAAIIVSHNHFSFCCCCCRSCCLSCSSCYPSLSIVSSVKCLRVTKSAIYSSGAILNANCNHSDHHPADQSTQPPTTTAAAYDSAIAFSTAAARTTTTAAAAPTTPVAVAS